MVASQSADLRPAVSSSNQPANSREGNVHPPRSALNNVRLGLATALCAIVAATGCASAESVGSAESALTQGEIVVYRAGEEVDQSELMDLGDPANLGATVLSGNPKISARFDYMGAGEAAGVFQGTKATAIIHYPFTEHATFISGKATLTDEHGNSHVFKAGDSYLITQGSNILWEIHTPRVQKSFFNRVEAADAPGPMVVYDKGHAVDECDLMDLGDPAGLGGTVVSGNPKISARFDFMRPSMSAGVFQGTRGEVIVDFPFTEHATVLRWDVKLEDENGVTHKLKPGDSYLIKQGSSIFWRVKEPRLQKSFLNVTTP